jgi:LemA protein
MTANQWAVLAAAAVLVFWAVGAYNRLVGLRNAIAAAWSQLDEQLRRRGAVIEPLVGALRAHLPYEEATFDAVLAAEQQLQIAADAVRSRPARAPTALNFVTAEGVLASALARLGPPIEQHAPLREDAAVGAALVELHDTDLHLALARRGFNAAVEAYNAAVRQFPTRLLAQLFAFEEAGRL